MPSAALAASFRLRFFLVWLLASDPAIDDPFRLEDAFVNVMEASPIELCDLGGFGASGPGVGLPPVAIDERTVAEYACSMKLK